MSKTHHIKILPEYYKEVIKGNKKAELRLNDRDYKVGDKIVLEEYENGSYTGRSAKVKITHLIEDFSGLEKDFVIFSFDLKQQDIVKRCKRKKNFNDKLEFHKNRLFYENKNYPSQTAKLLYSRGYIYGARYMELSRYHKKLCRAERRGEKAGVKAFKRSMKLGFLERLTAIFKKIKGGEKNER